LVSIKYDSQFRDLSHAKLDSVMNPKKSEDDMLPAGMVHVNKKLAARLSAKKDQAANDAPVDPKKAGKAPPPKKEEAAKKPAKGAPTPEEEEAEAERLR
jgi:hypothetical protein